jgi:hypothetical protein
MSFDNDARAAGFSGTDLDALLAVFTKASVNVNPTLHDEVGRRLIRMFRAGLRDPDMLAAFAGDALRPLRRKRNTDRTLHGEAGIINVCDM